MRFQLWFSRNVQYGSTPPSDRNVGDNLNDFFYLSSQITRPDVFGLLFLGPLKVYRTLHKTYYSSLQNKTIRNLLKGYDNWRVSIRTFNFDFCFDRKLCHKNRLLFLFIWYSRLVCHYFVSFRGVSTLHAEMGAFEVLKIIV